MPEQENTILPEHVRGELYKKLFQQGNKSGLALKMDDIERRHATLTQLQYLARFIPEAETLFAEADSPAQATDMALRCLVEELYAMQGMLTCANRLLMDVWSTNIGNADGLAEWGKVCEQLEAHQRRLRGV